MAIIAKMSNSKSAGAAINYAIGKDKGLAKNGTDEFLTENGIDPSSLHNRAVVMSGTNGVDPEEAVSDFKAWRQVNNQDKVGNQAHLIVQAFNFDELSATNPDDWQKANDLGVELATRLYPDYQSAVYTHIDGTNHQVHNHIVISKVSLETGKKLRENRGEGLKRARAINDEIAKEQGWTVLEKPKEAWNRAEDSLGADSWRVKIKRAVDDVMQSGKATSFAELAERLSEAHISVSERGNSLSYSITENGKEHRVRGSKLGTDYNKEAIFNELERQANTKRAAVGLGEYRSEIIKREQQINEREQQFAVREQQFESIAQGFEQRKSRIDEFSQSIIERKQTFERSPSFLDRNQQRLAEAMGTALGNIRERMEQAFTAVKGSLFSKELSALKGRFGREQETEEPFSTAITPIPSPKMSELTDLTIADISRGLQDADTFNPLDVNAWEEQPVDYLIDKENRGMTVTVVKIDKNLSGRDQVDTLGVALRSMGEDPKSFLGQLNRSIKHKQWQQELAEEKRVSEQQKQRQKEQPKQAQSYVPRETPRKSRGMSR